MTQFPSPSLVPCTGDTTQDHLLGGRLSLRQWRTGHRAGSDALLLAAAAPVDARQIIDAGAGTGAAGLALALRVPAAELVLIEQDAALAALAQHNLEANGMAGRGRVVSVDFLVPAHRRACGLAPDQGDVLITNPPFYEAASVRVSPDPSRARAHVHAGGGGHAGAPVHAAGEGQRESQEDGLARWIRACTALLAPGGTLVMIHRADSLGAVLALCAGRFGAVRVRPVHARRDTPATRILVTARKGSRAPLQIEAGLILHEDDGRFTPLAEALHRGEAVLA